MYIMSEAHIGTFHAQKYRFTFSLFNGLDKLRENLTDNVLKFTNLFAIGLECAKEEFNKVFVCISIVFLVGRS